MPVLQENKRTHYKAKYHSVKVNENDISVGMMGETDKEAIGTGENSENYGGDNFIEPNGNSNDRLTTS